MNSYEFQSHHGTKRVTVRATNEDEARRQAMIEMWGAAKDAVVPYAPDYKGTGLVRVK